MESLASSKIRLAVFDWLNSLIFKYPDFVFPSKVLANDFIYKDDKIVLTGQQGIWKPKQLQYPITIKSRIDSIYQDEFISDNRIKYKYMGTNPNHWVNNGLRDCMNNKIPLIYLHEVSRGKYLTQWPVYIVHDDIKNLNFIIEADNQTYQISNGYDEINEPVGLMRRYATRQMIQRLHQGTFREKVLEAYREHCAICKLKHRELLDAAHIIPDTKGGLPVVPNGISLCKIHHAAFDQNIIGITPDYKIEVRKDILQEIDGPMLKHGIQEMHGKQLILPHSISLHPKQEWLEDRYSIFKNVV